MLYNKNCRSFFSIQQKNLKYVTVIIIIIIMKAIFLKLLFTKPFIIQAMTFTCDGCKLNCFAIWSLSTHLSCLKSIRDESLILNLFLLLTMCVYHVHVHMLIHEFSQEKWCWTASPWHFTCTIIWNYVRERRKKLHTFRQWEVE